MEELSGAVNRITESEDSITCAAEIRMIDSRIGISERTASDYLVAVFVNDHRCWGICRRGSRRCSRCGRYFRYGGLTDKIG